VAHGRTAAGRGWVASFVAAYQAVFLGLAAASMAAIVLIMSLQVFYRYVLNDSLIWAEEMCRYLLMIMTFLLLGPAFERGDMATVQFFVQALPRRIGHAVVVAMYVLVVGFLLIVSYFGYRYAAYNGNFAMPAVDFVASAVLGRPVSGVLAMYWIYLLIPIGCLLLAAHFVVALVREIGLALGMREAV
jgi:TRAP-type C4-dicarboxylate transport system permease small subunit